MYWTMFLIKYNSYEKSGEIALKKNISVKKDDWKKVLKKKVKEIEIK